MELERRVSVMLREFARTMVTEFAVQGILDRFVAWIVDVLPISGAGVTLISPGSSPHYVAASDESALRFERLQTTLGQGPCVLAFESGELVAAPDLRADDRFPHFGPEAVDAGLVAVFTFPLRHGDHQVGALDLYRNVTGPLTNDELEAAQTLADVASAYVTIAEDRAELVESTSRAHQIALHDALTGLPNRLLLVERLEHALARCRRSSKSVGLMYIDLDGFKSVNDTFGHQIGDELLMAVAARLTELLRPGDTVARLAGDEFAVLCEDLAHTAQLEPIADRICAAFRRPFELAAGAIDVSASVGVAIAGPAAGSAEEMLEEADIAMYHAKGQGGGRHALLEVGEHQRFNDRAKLRRDLGRALERNQIHSVYQPIVSARDGRMVGVEALLRWSHPEQGLISAEIAVTLAEQANLIHSIGRRMLEQACLDRRRWLRQGQADLTIAVNVSALQLMAPDFATTVTDVLAATDTEPSLVILEVTETAFVHDSDRALVVLDDLKRIGVQLALDDFGTGYSSLSYLMRFPIDIVKIDRAFINGMDHDPRTDLIVRAVISMAHGLGMEVVAEGVETAEQHAKIAALGGALCQGFHFARPMSADKINEIIDNTTSHPLRDSPVSRSAYPEPNGSQLIAVSTS